MRGTEFCAVLDIINNRITPACAGNREARLRSATNVEDHPRVCGEQAHMHHHQSLLSGSPPRVRGTDEKTGMRTVDVRITPACAGNRINFLKLGLLCINHPRVCGEQEICRMGWPPGGGSPPRVRGTVGRGNSPPLFFRITPACAGNSP